MDRLNCSRVMFLQMLSVAKKARRRGIATNLARFQFVVIMMILVNILT